MTETPLELVRTATHDAHERVEELTRKLGVLQSRAAFARHLQTLWQHHQRELQRVSEHTYEHQCIQQRVEELAHDIVTLGEPVPPAGGTADKGCSLCAALGVTYVVEGSRLGAFAIAKMLTKNGISTQGLLSVGGDIKEIRQRFQATATRINALTPGEAMVMAEAAKQSFDDLLVAYTNWLAEGHSA